jgi:hypothetical protein
MFSLRNIVNILMCKDLRKLNAQELGDITENGVKYQLAKMKREGCFIVEVNPPDARIRDFGSLNGTYVNEKKIGSRGRK